MSKKKLLIHKVFEKIKKSSERDTKTGWSSDLVDYFDEHLNFVISKRTLIRYYEAYIEGDEDIDIELYVLNRLSQYLGFDDYENFSTTIIKEGEDASKTTVRIGVDNNPVLTNNPGSGVNIYIDNNNSNNNKNDQHYKIPEFIKQNGLGIVEMAFVLLLFSGGIMFSNNKKPPFGIGEIPDTEKSYMYWNGEKYIATDSSYLSPQIDVIPMDPKTFVYQKKIMRPDTLTIENGDHKVWYDKSNNHVEFFTNYGRHPENGKTLKEATGHILEIYAGADSSQDFAGN